MVGAPWIEALGSVGCQGTISSPMGDVVWAFNPTQLENPVQDRADA
jgi:hypothetical protein